MSVSNIEVSRKFANDFESVATRYNLRELGEYDEAKVAARRDLENAETCFAAMADEITPKARKGFE